MKIYNKKGFISGIVWLSICLVGIFAMAVKGFSLKLTLWTLLLFLFSIASISRSFSKASSLEDLLADTDERDRYILLKTANKSLQIFGWINFAVTISLMIIYAITKNNYLLGAFILSSLYITIIFIVTLCTNIYYEKHE